MEDSKQEQSQSPKLKAFEKIQEDFATVGITPSLPAQSCPFNGTILFGFLLIGSANYCVLEYIIFDAENFDEYTRSVYSVSAQTIILLALLILILGAEKIFEFINDGNDLINTTLKYSPSQSIFSETNQFERKLSKYIFFVLIKITPACVFVPYLLYNYFIYFTTDLGPDAFELPYPMRLPFDWKNPFGFLLAMTWQCVLLLYITLIGSCLMNLAIGPYVYTNASSKCVKESLISIRRCARVKTNPNILEQFIESIQFYSRVKQWLINYSNILQPLLTLFFTWSVATLYGALLMIQIQLVHYSDNLAALWMMMLVLVYTFSIFFILCELGQRTNLVECTDMIDQLKWYLFPAKIRRMLPMILSFTQQPIEIKCFGSMKSNRETFKYLISTSFSYFTILREFNASKSTS